MGALFVYQVLCGGSSPGLNAVPQILAGARAAGRWVGIQNSIGSMAGIVAPAATGLIVAIFTTTSSCWATSEGN